MKIIFLDIDGVLNYRGKMDSEILEKECLDNLQKIVIATDAKIVIISTWKCFWEMEKEDGVTHEYKIMLENEFKKRGIEIIDIAPELCCEREQEIKLWLWCHVNIKSYVIIDDWDCNYIKELHVQPSWYDKGLTSEHVTRAINILN